MSTDTIYMLTWLALALIGSALFLAIYPIRLQDTGSGGS